jgi:hypothetical protein
VALVGPSKRANTPSPVCFARWPPCFAGQQVDDFVVGVELATPASITGRTELFCGADGLGSQDADPGAGALRRVLEDAAADG